MIAKMEKSSTTSESLRCSDRMSERLHSSGQTILDTVQSNDCIGRLFCCKAVGHVFLCFVLVKEVV